MLGKIDAPLDKMINEVEWGEYRIGNLFDSSNGDFDIQKKHINGLGERVITSGLANNGIAGKTDVEARIFDEKTITIDMFGNAFYRNFKYKMVTHARVFSLKPNFTVSDRQGLFLSIALRWLSNVYSFGQMCSWEKIKDLTFFLPTHCGTIDFVFMEKYIAELEAQRIAELEAQRIAELEAYLSATGLKDYNFTAEEQNALSEFGKCEWVEYDIPSVFEVRNTNSIMSRDVVENSGTIPYLCASSEDNGVSSYISYNENCIDRGNCVFIGGKTFVVSYQERDFFSNDSHNLSLTLLEEKWREKRVQLFLATCVRKSLGHKYSWGDSISHSKIMSDTISLPVIDGEINYGIMSAFIRAIEKLVIRDVVDYADKKIAMTQRVCAG